MEHSTAKGLVGIPKDNNLGDTQSATGRFLVQSMSEELLLVTPKSTPMQITLQVSSFELFSFVPLVKLSNAIKFAPIGLTNMFNSGGTIQDLKYNSSKSEISAKIKVKGAGNFLAYSNKFPKECRLNGAEVAFMWLADIYGGKVVLSLPWIEELGGISDVDLFF